MEEERKTHIFALRTTANREDQVIDFVSSNAAKKGLDVYAVIRPHGMRGYIFLEAKNRQSAEEAAFGVPYARGILSQPIDYPEIEHMLEQVKREISIKKNDIVEIISGPFRREQAKVTRIDKTKEDVVVELPMKEQKKRKEEILDAVAWGYHLPHSRILKYDGKKIRSNS